MTVSVYSQTINKLVNEAANDSARVSGQDRKISPALGTYQIAGCGGLAWKKIKHSIVHLSFKVSTVVVKSQF